MGWLSDLINKAKKKTQETVQGISQGVQNATQNVASGVQNAVQNVTSGYSDWLNGVQENVSSAMKQGKNALGGIVDNAGQVAGNVIDAATNGAQQVQQGIDYGKQAAGEAAANLAPKIDQAIATGQQAVENIGNQVYQKAQETGTNIYNQAVDKANEAKAAVGQFVDKAQDAAGQAITDATNRVNNFVSDTTQAVGNAVQNVSQGVTDKVNDINNKIQGNTTTQAPSVTEPVTQGSQAPTVTPSTTPSTTTPSPEQTATNTQTQVTTPNSQIKEEPILSYEDYLKKESEGLGYIKDQTTQHIDQQNKDTLAHIDETLASGKKYAEDVKNTTDAALETQKNADVAYAESQRDLMKDTSQAERDAVYKYAEETLAGALGYNQEAYGKLVEAITGQMEAGKLAASEAKNLLMIMAEEAKNTTYGAAERQRQEAERQADINRQRAITDANSAYEQNKASYGAKAEALGNMGLTAGGYGDWLNASAYAQQRSEVQGARAQSDAAKREAKYTEDMTKLQADQEYSNKKYQAESEYQSKLHDIDTSYRTNMSEAEQSKLAADKAAQDAEREAKRQADSKHNENVYNADSSYADWINKAETAERDGKLQSDIEYKGFLYESEKEANDKKLQANQSAENAKLNAEISYVEGILSNSKALAEYKESLKAGDAAAEEKKLAVYEQLLAGVNNGTYDAETAAALADAFGFGDEWKTEIANASGRKKESDAGLKAEADAAQNKQDFTSVLIGAANGEYNEETVKAIAKEYGFSEEQTEAVIKAAAGSASGKTGDIFVDSIISATRGELDATAAEAIAKQYNFNEEQTNALMGAVKSRTDAVNKEQRVNNFGTLLEKGKTGALTAEEITTMAGELGFDVNNPEDKKLIDLAVKAAEGYAAASDEEKQYQKSMNALTVLDGVKNGTYTAEEIPQIAAMLGLDAEKDAGIIKMLTDAANGYSDMTEEQQQTNAFLNLLGSANNGELTKDELNYIAGKMGLGEEEIGMLNEALDRAASGDEAAINAAKAQNFGVLLEGAKTGAYGADEVEAMAKMLGLDPEKDKNLIDMLTGAANGYSDMTEEQQQTNAFLNLLGSANNGELTKDELNYIAGKMGLGEEEIGMLNEALDRAASGDEAAIKAAKAQNFGVLLEGANTGAYGADEVEAMAKMLGLDPEKDKNLIDMLTGAAEGYESDKEAAITKSEEQQKTSDFLTLLGSAGSGELTKDEVMQIAEMLGFDPEADKELLDLIGKAADRYASGTEEELKLQKTMNFISLLDGANTGAYDEDQIEKMATMLGLDPEADKELIDMLKTAATDFANGEAGKTAKEDMQYQNNLFAEMLSIANQGGYTSEQLKELGAAFGLSQDKIDALTTAADNYETNKKEAEKNDSVTTAIDLKNQGYITSDTTDEEIDDFVEAGLIQQSEADKLKEDRNQMGVDEINDSIKIGDYAGAIARAEELYADGTGTIDIDTYQNAYFEATLNNCSQAKTNDDIEGMLHDIENLRKEGKITNADASALTNFMYSNAGEAMSILVNPIKTAFGSRLKFSVGETSLEVGYDAYLHYDEANNKTSKILDSISKASGNVNCVMYQGKLYHNMGEGWRVLPDKNKLYSEYNKKAGYSTKPEKPTHKTSFRTYDGRDTADAYAAIKANDYEKFKTFYPPNTSEDHIRSEYEKYGGR